MAQLKRYIRDNHLAFIALFLALGGTSYAAVSLPRDSVGSKQIRQGAVTSSEVRNRSLLAEDFKGGELPRGARGAAGARGVTGPKGETGAAGPAGKDGQAGQAGGAAGGSLAGTYPNPTIANGAVGPDQLAQKPTVRLIRSGTAFTIPTGAGGTSVPWPTPTGPRPYDFGGFFNPPGGVPSQCSTPAQTDTCIVFPRTGTYAISAGLRWGDPDTSPTSTDATDNGVGSRTIRIHGLQGRQSGSQTTPAASGAPTLQSVTTIDRFNAGEASFVSGTQDSGQPVNVYGSLQQVYLTAAWIGP